MKPRRIDGAGALANGYASGQVFHSVIAQTSGLSNIQANIHPPKEARLVIVDVFMSGQTLLVASGAGGTGQMDYGVNWIRNDGGPFWYHPGPSTAARSLLDANQHIGNWDVQFRLMKSHSGGEWMGYIRGTYGHTTGDSLSNMNGSHFRLKGRLITYISDPAQAAIRFATRSGESGLTNIQARAAW